MIQYTRNTENLKQAIREHTVSGYPLQVPTFKNAIAINTVSIPRLTTIVTELVPPMPFQDLAAFRGWSRDRETIEYWLDYTKQKNLPRSDENPLKWMHPKSQALLEEGYSTSSQEIQATWLKELGHLDSEGMIRKFSFPLNTVEMDPRNLQPGMIVEYQDYTVKGKPTLGPFAGRVLGVEQDSQDGSPVVLLESFEPVPALLAPRAISPWMIDPSYVPSNTWALGYGTYRAMQKRRVKIPSGMFDPQDAAKRVFFLDQPMPLSKVQKFCEKNYPKNPECVWQSMVFMVMPIHPSPDPDQRARHQGGSFRPYPDDLQTTQIEAQIDYFTEGMEFEE